MSLRVFISYSHNDDDRPVAQSIVKLLAAMKVELFIDEDIEPGEDFDKRIKEEMSRCPAIVIIISPASLESGYVPYESSHAQSLGLPVISYLMHSHLEHKLPGYLRKLQYAKTLEDVRKYFEKLVNLGLPAPLSPEEEGAKLIEAEQDEFIKKVGVSEIDSLKASASADDLYSSFQPGREPEFLWLRIPTTPGFTPDDKKEKKEKKRENGEKEKEPHYKKTDNEIYIVRDPVRGFEIQIG